MGCRRNPFCILGRDHAERKCRTAEDPDEQPSEPTGADNNANTEGGSIAQGQIINLVVVKPNKSARCGVVMASNEETGMTYIRSVTRGGLFESAGARENDFLMSIDGEEVTGSKMAAALLGGADGRFEVMIERSGPMWVSESVEAVLAKADNTLDHGNHELGVIMGQTLPTTTINACVDAASSDEPAADMSDVDASKESNSTALVVSGTEGVRDLSAAALRPSGVLASWEEHEAYIREVLPKMRSLNVSSSGTSTCNTDNAAGDGGGGVDNNGDDVAAVPGEYQPPAPRWRSEKPPNWQPWPVELRERLSMMGERLEMLDERLLEAKEQWQAEYIGEEAVRRRDGMEELPPEAIYGKEKIEEQEVVVETMYGKLVRAVAMSCEDPELTALLTEAEEAAAEEEETSEQQRVVDQVD